MNKIKLPLGTYDFDPSKPLGKKGGFGQVFLGCSSTSQEVAVKQLHVSAKDAGHRELEIAAELKGRSFEHVVPFIDAGEDADSGQYFLVMPKADGSLQAYIEKNGNLKPVDVADVMLQISKGLREVRDLVHRDLKPDNVLLHQGKWKVADFGIARFLQDVTSSNTLKDYLSKLYAAPEQWQSERATHATDIYALGCIGFFLLTGKPPFTADPKQEHQYAPVPDFVCSDNRLKGLIKNMLRKPPESRPSSTRVENFLAEITNKPLPLINTASLTALAAAGAAVSEKEEKAEAELEVKRKASKARNQLAVSSFEILSESVERLWGKIHSTAISARRASKELGDIFEVQLGQATLTINTAGHGSAIESGKFQRSGWDVVAMSAASVIQTKPHYEWGAALWYAKLKGSTEYRWYEVGYRANMVQSKQFDPFVAEIEDADWAASNTMHTVAIAYGPSLIDDEHEENFHSRWLGLLAQASGGTLSYPVSNPIEGWPPPKQK